MGFYHSRHSNILSVLFPSKIEGSKLGHVFMLPITITDELNEHLHVKRSSSLILCETNTVLATGPIIFDCKCPSSSCVPISVTFKLSLAYNKTHFHFRIKMINVISEFTEVICHLHPKFFFFTL